MRRMFALFVLLIALAGLSPALIVSSSALSPTFQAVLLGAAPDNPVVSLNFATSTYTGCATIAACASDSHSNQMTMEPPGGTLSYCAASTLCVSAAGLHSFDASTNLVPQSQAATGWTATNATLVAGSAGTSPDGSSAELVMTDNNTSGSHGYAVGSLTLTSGHTYVFSVFGKAGTCAQSTNECKYAALIGGNVTAFTNLPIVNVDWSTCQVLTSQNVQRIATPVPYANGWCKISFLSAAVGTTQTGSSLFTVQMMNVDPSGGGRNQSYVGASSTMKIWGAYVSDTTKFLPYCPTSGASATCNANLVADSGLLKTALEGSALRFVAKTYNLSWQAQNTAAPVLGVGTALTGLGLDTGSRASTSWPNSATINAAAIALWQTPTRYNVLGYSADGSGRCVAMNGSPTACDSNAPSASTQEYLGAISSGATCNCIIASVQVWSSRKDSALPAATANPNAPTLVASYTGNTALRTRIMNALIAPATATQAMSIKYLVAGDTIVNPVFRLPCYYVLNATAEAETAPGANCTGVTASVEYPQGTCTQLKVSAATSWTITNGSYVLTDAATGVTIPYGAGFALRAFLNNTAGIVNVGVVHTAAFGEGMHTGTSGISDQTVTCDAVTNTSSSTLYGPEAVFSATQQPVTCPIGDSRTQGSQDTISDLQYGFIGNVERWLAPVGPMLNMGVGGDQAQRFVISHANRITLLANCTNMIVALGVNDVFNSAQTSGQIETSLTTIYGYNTNLVGGAGKVWALTVMGKTTTSNNWTDVAGQTLVSGSSTLAPTVNDWIRANTAGIAGFFDEADALSTSRNSGIWIANGVTIQGYTKDGLHPSQNGYQVERNTFGFPLLNFLLKRDVGGAVNDNSPAWISEAA